VICKGSHAVRVTSVWRCMVTSAGLAILGTACSPYTLLQKPREPMSQVMVGGSGALDYGGFSGASSDDSVGAVGTSIILGQESAADGGLTIERLDADLELLQFFDEDIGQGLQLIDFSFGFSYGEPWREGQRLYDSRISYGYGLFLSRASIGQGSETLFSWSGYGVQASGEYEVRCGAGESWDLSSFIGAGVQLGLVEAGGDALSASSGGSGVQSGLAAQFGVRCYWDKFFVETAYLHRYVDVSDVTFDLQGALISFGVTW
jgi:hypothetical protein